MYFYQISFTFSYVWLPRPFVLIVFGVGYLLCSLCALFSVVSFIVDYFVRTGTVHSSPPPQRGSAGSSPFVMFLCLFYFFCPWFCFVSFHLFLGFFFIFFWFFVSSVCWNYQRIYLCIIKQLTHTQYRHTTLKQRPLCRDLLIKQAVTQLHK